MKSKVKELLFMCCFLIVLILFLFAVAFFISAVSDYFDYKQYVKEGYAVRYVFDWNWLWHTEILIKNNDGSVEWKLPRQVGNDFVIKNYAVKEEDSKE